MGRVSQEKRNNAEANKNPAYGWAIPRNRRNQGRKDRKIWLLKKRHPLKILSGDRVYGGGGGGERNKMLTIDVDMKKIRVSLLEMAEIMKNEWPFIRSRAANTCADEIVKEIYKEMKRVFNNPTPYTLNSLQSIHGDKAKPDAFINFKRMGNKTNHYLQAEVFGGTRDRKKSESALKSAGLMGSNQYYVPTKYAPLNAYGNLPSNFIVSVINQSDRGKSSKYFILPKQKGKLRAGVYEYASTDKAIIRRIINFVPNVNYRKLFYFFEKTKQEFNNRINKHVQDAIKYCKLNPYLKK